MSTKKDELHQFINQLDRETPLSAPPYDIGFLNGVIHAHCELAPDCRACEDVLPRPKPIEKTGYTLLKEQLHHDPEYAYSWHSNIAMQMYDALRDSAPFQDISHDLLLKAVNQGATAFMGLAFDIETSQHMLSNLEQGDV